MLYRFDVKLRPECDRWIVQNVFFVWQKGRLMVELKRRD
jgi:hypothetical protein